MDRIQIRGGGALNGVIPISGAKNAALPLMIASLLTDQTLTLENLPRLADVAQLARILGNHGVDYSIDGKRVGEEAASGQTAHLRARTIVDTTAPYELVAKMRASFWVIAPLLARMGEARVSLPGGCAIGTRPVDLLLMALEKLGAQIEIDGGYAVAKAPKGLVGGGDRISQGDGRGNACRDDGGVDRARGDAHPQRGARAGGRRSRRLPQQDGRAHPRRRHLDDRNRGRRPPQRRAPSRSARPHRGGHLRDRGRDDRRRRPARGRRRGPAGRGPGRARGGRRDGDERQSRRARSAQRRRHRARSMSQRRRFPGFPPICRRSSWR